MATQANQKYLNIARPYALAAFEFARDKKQLAEWKAFLESASSIAKQKDVMHLLANPEIAATQWFTFFSDILSTVINNEQKNFLHLLSQNHRLMLLPEIADVYQHYFATLEKISTIRVITATDVSNEYKQKLSAALAKRVQRDVTLHCEVEPSVLGGAIIHIGDRVIDGSIRGKLSRLYKNLTG